MERVKVQRISKSFWIGSREQRSALEHVLAAISGREPKQKLDALLDVSLTVFSGEMVGIVGANGSGKSTLLRVIAGIYQPDGGVIETAGRIAALTQLGTGMRERLTMRENIYLVCALLGLSMKNTRDIFDSVVDFSELAQFLDTKWYQFSDGMRQRTMFSIAVHAPSDILLLDEAFAVGDEHFCAKGLARLETRAAEGTSIVMTGHYLPIFKEHCARVIWLDSGRIRMEGEAVSVVEAYEKNSQ